MTQYSNNPMNFINMMRGAGNPQQFMMNVMQEMANKNPIYANLLTLARNRDSRGIEQVARNLLQEKGLNFDKEFSAFRQQYKI